MGRQEKAGGGTHQPLHMRQSMADVEFDDFGDGFAAGHAGRFGRAINLAGAACSVALIVGLGVWGYKLAVRDVQGSGVPGSAHLLGGVEHVSHRAVARAVNLGA